MKRPRLSAFGDEIDPDLSRQLEVLKANSVEHLELRAAWGVNVVELGPARLAQAAGLLQEFGVGVSAIGSPVGKSEIEGDFESELDRLRVALAAAARLETPLVRVFSFFIPEGRHAQHRDEVLRRMAAFAGEADQLAHVVGFHVRGFRLNIQLLWPDGWLSQPLQPGGA